VDAAALVVEPGPVRASRRAKPSQGGILSQGRV